MPRDREGNRAVRGMRCEAHRSRERGAWNRADLCEQGLKRNTNGLQGMSNNNELNWTETDETSTDLTLSIYDLSGSYVGVMALS